jgi:hypothetical protein
MSWLARRRRDTEPVDGPSRREVSAALMRSVKRVFAAQRMCSVATGVELAVARRELTGVLRDAMTRAEGLVATSSSRLQLMARKETAIMVEMSRPWLLLDFLAIDRSWCVDPEFSSAKRARLQRSVLERAAEVIAEARADEPSTGRETLRQLIDEVAVFSSPLVTAAIPERRVTEWRLVAEEVTGLAAAALAQAGHTSGGELP